MKPEAFRKRRRKWRWIPAGGGLLLLLLLFLGLGLPRDYRLPPADEAEIAAAQSVVEKLHGAMTDRDGYVAEAGRIVLTGEEINALLRGAVRAYQWRNRPSFGVAFEAGIFYCRFSQPLAIGLAANGELRFTPCLENRQLRVDWLGGRIGWLPVPAGLIQSSADRAIAELTASEEFALALQVVRTIRLNDRRELEMEFNPREIGPLLQLLSRR